MRFNFLLVGDEELTKYIILEKTYFKYPGAQAITGVRLLDEHDEHKENKHIDDIYTEKYMENIDSILLKKDELFNLTETIVQKLFSGKGFDNDNLIALIDALEILIDELNCIEESFFIVKKLLEFIGNIAKAYEFKDYYLAADLLLELIDFLSIIRTSFKDLNNK